MRFVILIFASLTILSATYFATNKQTVKDLIQLDNLAEGFEVPIITNEFKKEGKVFYEAYSIFNQEGIIIGKYPKSKSLKLTEEDPWKLYDERLIREIEGFYSSDGFQIFPDPETYIPTNFTRGYTIDGGGQFPVYLINETSEIKKISNQHDLKSVQEALDSNGRWYPIQTNITAKCGTGRYALQVCPDEMVVFLMPKFEGNYKTKLRVRLMINDQVIISKPYAGSINYQQFEFIPNDDYEQYVFDDLKSNPVGIIRGNFAGAIPKAYAKAQGWIR